MGTCCQVTRNRIDTTSDTGESITERADSMQEVLDNIYMGSAVAAKNKQLLIDNGITHIIAIGWNLEIHFQNDFEYLLINKIEDSPECIILNQFSKCFNFIEECFKNKGKLFVHCHKGLSRSATIVIAHEMYKNGTDFDFVLNKLRKNRSFIMPNIGFQAQLQEFKNQNYSLQMDKYNDFNVLLFIQQCLPKMLQRIQYNYNAYKTSPDHVNEDELFELTLYLHQVFKLKQKDKLNQIDIQILNESIQILRDIQVEFVQNQSSIKRFDIMFKNKSTKNNKKYNDVIDSSLSVDQSHQISEQKEESVDQESDKLIAT